MTVRFRSNFAAPSGFVISFTAKAAEEPAKAKLTDRSRRDVVASRPQTMRRPLSAAGSGTPAIKAAAP